MRIGSLFSGYGGLEAGVQAVLGGEPIWHCEYEPPSKSTPRPTQAAARVLAHRFPGVPNLGDITKVDWLAVPKVDVLCGGFPCQDVSSAGLRRGLKEDTRSGLWAKFAVAIDVLRPPLVVIENVRGLLNAEADSDVEPCPWCVGDGESVVLRALGAVLGDLADLGYDTSWQGVQACDIGAPHERFRVFVVAWPADPDPAELGRRPARGDDGVRAAGLVAEPPAHTLGGGRDRRTGELWPRRWDEPPDGGADAAADAASDGRDERRAEPARLERGPDAALGSVPAAAHPDSDAVREQPVAVAGSGGAAVAGLSGADAPADTDDAAGHGERARPQSRIGSEVATDADGPGRGRLAKPHSAEEAGEGACDWHDLDRLAVAARGLDWGEYGPAVHRWEQILGRLAPWPNELGRNGQPRLSPAFVEWMQGLPAGWVTAVPGLTRNEQLKALGNGVVPAQAAYALRLLLTDVPWEVAA